jgi:hypothetical protein
MSHSPSILIRCARGWLVAGACACVIPALPMAQVHRSPLTSVAGLRLHNVTAVPAVLLGKTGLKVTMADDVRQRLQAMTPDGRQRAAQTGATVEQLVMVDGLEFGDGTITAEIAGDVEPGVFEGARGFVGIAFRLQPDMRTYDAFYLRPTNGRADDQIRRNHAVQYISHPEWTWSRLRSEFPSKYESYVDLEVGTWTTVKVEVKGAEARLYVHDQTQPTLIVNDLRTGPQGRGAVALWLDIGTVAHFRNLRVTR